MPQAPSSARLWYRLAAGLGTLAFVIVLGYHNLADGDLWARLAAGASVWVTGRLWPYDPFAFTPTLPEWVDHEWGAGTVFFGVLKLFGAGGLLGLKTLLALGALGLSAAAARRRGATTAAILTLAIPCAWTLLPGYVPVVRSHAFTYAAFGLLIWLLDRLCAGRVRVAPLVPVLMLLWANLHGGFVAGYGLLGVYALAALAPGQPRRLMLLTVALAVIASTITPYGLRFWKYLIPALLHPRSRIAEWAPMPLWRHDVFSGFRVLCAVAVAVVVAAWQCGAPAARRRRWPDLLLLAITMLAAWRHKRHAPFFGVAALAVLPAWLDAVLARIAALRPGFLAARLPRVLGGTYVALAFAAVVFMLPSAPWQVLAPVGAYPVRETDILSRAQVAGRLVVPFEWGSYALWRLYPRIRISMDGRYEEVYPESTFELNDRFYQKQGPDWDRLVRDWAPEFVIVDRRRTRLTATDLAACGYGLVREDTRSALWARSNLVARLAAVAAALPEETIDPLDARIPEHWPWPAASVRPDRAR